MEILFFWVFFFLSFVKKLFTHTHTFTEHRDTHTHTQKSRIHTGVTGRSGRVEGRFYFPNGNTKEKFFKNINLIQIEIKEDLMDLSLKDVERRHFGDSKLKENCRPTI